MKKIEFIIESVYVKRLLGLLKEKGITGYTLIKDIEGSGVHGLKRSDEITDISSNNYIFTVCEEEKLLLIRDAITVFLKKHGGKCLVSDVSFIE
jgi:nitrogen regulatory protein PII